MKKTIILLLCLSALFSSCEDWFTHSPESEMVKEDFWNRKSDVLSAVGACYRAMAEEGFIKRLIAWGEMRSDNVIPGKSNETDVVNILEANITSSNQYCRWGDIYNVINLANTVLAEAPSVKLKDPDFSDAELHQYEAEVKAIRAFCYFLLVRTFRDVPYITEPYSDDSRSFQIAQTDGDTILKNELANLASAKEYAPAGYSNLSYTHGRVTRKAVIALMADINLWLENYKECADLCNEIINDAGSTQLERSSSYFNNVFFTGNSNEGIWEIQFDNNTLNYATRDFYGSSSTDGKLSCYDYSFSGASALFAQHHDLRLDNAFVSSDGFFLIKKYIARLSNNTSTTIRNSDFTYGNSTDNWILYRYADVLLMRAEALAEIGDQKSLDEAVRLVSRTYDRANPGLEAGTLIGQYSSQEQVRNLVFDERQREFLFEGKRYFDLLRRMRREKSPTQVINTYLIKKYITQNLDRTTVMSKLNDVNAVYLPIHEDELHVNLLLVQNKFYKTSSDITKN